MKKACQGGDREAIIRALGDESLGLPGARMALKYALQNFDEEIAKRVIPIEEKLLRDLEQKNQVVYSRFLGYYCQWRDDLDNEKFRFLIKCGANVNITRDNESWKEPILDYLLGRLESAKRSVGNTWAVDPKKQKEKAKGFTKMCHVLIAHPRTNISKVQKGKITDAGLAQSLRNRKIAALYEENAALRLEMQALRDDIYAPETGVVPRVGDLEAKIAIIEAAQQ
jgi:hypothetical protein